ncbi:hypothetical protein ACTQXY_11755 [Faecalimonas sp. LCP19S3_D12]
MSKGSKAQFKQFTINTAEDACLVLKSLIVPTTIDLEKLKRYADEAQNLLGGTSSPQTISAKQYETVRDKVLYVQRELLRFLADYQSSSFSYISVRPIFIKKGFLKRNLDDESTKAINELLDVRNWTFHNAQSILVADLEHAKKTIPSELVGIAEIHPMLNPVIIRRPKSYSRPMLEGFIHHNEVRIKQFDTILSEMKKDYQELYDLYCSTMSMPREYNQPGQVQYMEYDIEAQTAKQAGANIAQISMGIQKGKYDGSIEAFNRLLNEDTPSS